EGELTIWNADTGEVHARVKEHVNHWDPFALSRDGKMLAVVRPMQRTGDCELVVYDLPAGKERCRVDREGYSHFAPIFTPDGKALITSSRESLCVWHPANGKLIREIPNVRGVVALSADGKQLACATRRAIHLFALPDFKAVRKFEEMPGALYVYALA